MIILTSETRRAAVPFIIADTTTTDRTEEGSDYLTEEIKADNEKKKEYLNSYRNLCRKLQSLEDQLQSFREVEQSAKIQQLSDMPKGGKQTDLSDLIVKNEVLFTKIVRMKADCLERKIEIENCIADMQEGLESAVLRKRYIEFKTWEQICVEIDYSWMQTHRHHSKALNNFKLPG